MQKSDRSENDTQALIKRSEVCTNKNDSTVRSEHSNTRKGIKFIHV